jgi:hypothetical protein
MPFQDPQSLLLYPLRPCSAAFPSIPVVRRDGRARAGRTTVSIARQFREVYRNRPGNRAAGSFRTEVVSMSRTPIKIQLLIRREWRTATGVEEAREAVARAGVTPTAVGLATISAEVDEDQFLSLFGTSAREAPPQPPGPRDFGRSAGHVSEPLTVPSSLERYIEAISVAPGHTYFQN